MTGVAGRRTVWYTQEGRGAYTQGGIGWVHTPGYTSHLGYPTRVYLPPRVSHQGIPPRGLTLWIPRGIPYGSREVYPMDPESYPIFHEPESYPIFHEPESYSHPIPRVIPIPRGYPLVYRPVLTVRHPFHCWISPSDTRFTVGFLLPPPGL